MTHPQADQIIARHPIGVVAQRTGLTTDVIRAWERRYEAVQPGRGEGGQRIYTDRDIERLRLLHTATLAGRSIGQVAHLPTDEVASLVAEDARARGRHGVAPDPGTGEVLAGAMSLTLALDGRGLDAMLRRAAAVTGVTGFIEGVAAPLLRRVGDEWHAGRLTVAQEHLAASVVHDILADAMRSLTAPADAPRAVVATLSGERHVIGAAAAGVIAAAERWEVVYLGSDVPAAEVAAAASRAGAGLVAVSMVHMSDRDRALAGIRIVRLGVPANVPIWVGGAGAAGLTDALEESGVRVGSSLAEFQDELRALRERPGYSATPPR